MAEERWFLQVKNPNSGEFLQLESLKALGIIPTDFRDGEKPNNYPIWLAREEKRPLQFLHP
jgi:hypothetical protein